MSYSYSLRQTEAASWRVSRGCAFLPQWAVPIQISGVNGLTSSHSWPLGIGAAGETDRVCGHWVRAGPTRESETRRRASESKAAKPKIRPPQGIAKLRGPPFPWITSKAQFSL